MFLPILRVLLTLAVLPGNLLSLVHSAPSGSKNSTFTNPMLPGFNPDPSCIFVKEWDNTFFCATSTFNAFPGIPIYTSKDLVNWKLIGHAVNRPEQLPSLGTSNGTTSGLWAPTLRYHKGTFWVVTTMVHNMLDAFDPARWDNFIVKAKNPHEPRSWSNAVHFPFQGYDPSPFWHENGKVYMTGGHAYRVSPGIHMATIDMETGVLESPFGNVWNGSGDRVPEGPHHYQKDGYYYLLDAEGGTGLPHNVAISRSKNIEGPYENNPVNPILTNRNTSSYFQTVGHADLFQDASGNWWAVALSSRGGPAHTTYPMGRETVLTPVTWKKGEWPICTPVNGKMSGWPLPPPNRKIPGKGAFINDPDNFDFKPGSRLPLHFTWWRFPDPKAYTISPPGHKNTLRLTPSKLNLTALDGMYADSPQTFIARRQTHSLFTYGVELDFDPKNAYEEAGVTVFLTQLKHIRLGITSLPNADNTELTPHFSFYAISDRPVQNLPKPTPLPEAWRGKKLSLEIKAGNETHYTFSAGLAGSKEEKKVLGVGQGRWVSGGFTGTFVGIYATRNGEEEKKGGATQAYFSKWRYTPDGQIIE